MNAVNPGDPNAPRFNAGSGFTSEKLGLIEIARFLGYELKSSLLILGGNVNENCGLTQGLLIEELLINTSKVVWKEDYKKSLFQKVTLFRDLTPQ